MKLIKRILLIFMTSFALLSCENVNITREADIYTPQILLNETYDKNKEYKSEKIQDYTLPVLPMVLQQMFDAKESFIFYFHNIECEHCEQIKPNLIRYILETKNTFYSLDIGDDLAFLELSKYYQDIKDQNGTYLFKNESSEFIYATPIFYIVKDGKILKKQLVTENMFNYKYFTKVMAKYLLSSSSYIFKTLDNVENYKFVFYYSNSIENYALIYNNLLFQPLESMAIVRLDLIKLDEICQIVNNFTSHSFILNESTTIDEVLIFLNNN